MNLTSATKRIDSLRAQYMQSPLHQKELGYGFWMVHGQDYLFTKGWMEAKATNSLYRRSLAYAHLYENMNPVILDHELLVGQPDYTPLTGEVGKEWDALWPHAKMIPSDAGRTDHKSLDFEKLLRLGVEGLLSEIEHYRQGLDLNEAEDMEKDNFYRCAETELRALLVLAENYKKHALSLAEKASGPRKEELIEIADILSRVPRFPAQTLREALQSMHFYTFCLFGLYQCGRPDQYLLPYYEKDIQNGVLTKAQAQELIDCFCLMYSAYINSNSSVGFMVGGRDRQGKAVENDLTWMFLESIPHTKTADPSIGLCVTDETSPELLAFAAKLLVEGYSHPAIYNDRVITESMQAYGVSQEDAHCYIHSCCVELTIDKKSDVWVVSPYHNCLLYLMEMLKDNTDCPDFDTLLERYFDYLRKNVIEKNHIQNQWQMERARNGGEPQLVSCLVDDCLKRGKGIYAGGAVYNWTQPNFLGISNLVESLLTIKQYVYEEKRFTLSALLSILSQNYGGNEALRQEILNKKAHFGIANEEIDAFYAQITRRIASCLDGIKNYRKDRLIPAAFSYNEHMRHGSQTPATPDGRLSGEPLADGSNPMQGFDTQGPTCMLLSVTAWPQHLFLGGVAVNLKVQKAINNEKNVAAMVTLIKTFLKRGGVEMQVTATDAEELKDALTHPEKHGDLLVRIGGYSDYFVKLSKEMQQEVLARTLNEV